MQRCEEACLGVAILGAEAAGGDMEPRGNARPRVAALRPIEARRARVRQHDAVTTLHVGRQVGVDLVQLWYRLVTRLQPRSLSET